MLGPPICAHHYHGSIDVRALWTLETVEPGHESVDVIEAFFCRRQTGIRVPVDVNQSTSRPWLNVCGWVPVEVERRNLELCRVSLMKGDSSAQAFHLPGVAGDGVIKPLL